MDAVAVIVAAGAGRRAGGETPKQFADLGGIPVLAWSVRTFLRQTGIGRVVVVLAPAVAADPPPWLAAERIRVVAGGETRQESVRRGVAAVPAAARTILIHDAARPFASTDLIARVLESCGEHGAVPGVGVRDTLKRTRGALVTETIDRSQLVAAQTPQGFPAGLIRRLHDTGRGERATDDAMLCEIAGVAVTVVPGDDLNFKITTAADLAYARWLVGSAVVSCPDPV